MKDRAPNAPARPALPLPPGTPRLVRIDAAASWDSAGISPGRVSLLVDNESPDRLEVLANATPEEVDAHPGAKHATGLDLADHVLLPGLVNAHTHLDLTHIGPVDWDPARPFNEWIDIILNGRLTDPDAIAASVRGGAALAIAGGTVAVGDIAGVVAGQASLAAAEPLGDSGLHGVSFVEFFAIGPRMEANLERARGVVRSRDPDLRPGRLRLGIQPHAPYSAQRDAYRRAIEWAGERGLPLSTHMAETPIEHEFIARGTGLQKAFLERLGAWHPSLLDEYAKGLHPVEHLEPILRAAGDAGRPFLVAHVNDATDRAIEILAETRTRVAYCPRSSAYFGAERHFGPHRYRDMLDAGVPVCLGTDSVVNITDGTLGVGTADDQGVCGAVSGRLSVLDEMRLLYRRDGADPVTLVCMGTSEGLPAVGDVHLSEQHFQLGGGPRGNSQGRPLAILGVPVRSGLRGRDAVVRALESDAPPISILTRILPVSQQ
ncbi:MAG: amidohydrolase family protein [Phycisphaerales bacterium]|nr:amidohydrolase family protein [Phycisphaerales bacterium]